MMSNIKVILMAPDKRDPKFVYYNFLSHLGEDKSSSHSQQEPYSPLGEPWHIWGEPKTENCEKILIFVVSLFDRRALEPERSS